MTHPIYLDYQATTPLDPRVREAMRPYWERSFGNAHSHSHAFGWGARRAVNRARAQVATALGADDSEIVFTSGATESCNLAIRGAVAASSSGRCRIVTVATEHPAVLETVEAMRDVGLEVVVLPVDGNGLVDLGRMTEVVDDRTLLVSVMAANNEIGVTQPVSEIADICHSAGVLVHTDATQAIGRMGVDVDELGVDLLTFSGHKIYGPKGVGALVVRGGTRVKLRPIITGGGQEGGLRAGTVPTPLVVGLGEACELVEYEWGEDASRMSRLGDRLLEDFEAACPEFNLFGHPTCRVPGSLSLGVPGLPAEELIAAIADRVAVSTGSACSSARAEPSRVLLALGLEPEVAATAVRISLGRFTTDGDIDGAWDAFAPLIGAVAQGLKA